MRPVGRALSRTLIATLVTAFAPSLAHAQSCLGFPLQPGQRSLGFQIATGFEDGGPGGFYSQVNRSGTSLHVDWVSYQIWDGPDIIDERAAVSARFAHPVKLGQQSGPARVCAAYDFGMVTGETSGLRAGYGLFYAITSRFGSAYAGPMLLGAFSEDGNSSGVGFLAGVSGRLGPVLLNVAAEPPVLPFDFEPALHIRFGFAWGRAVSPPPPVQTTPSRPAAIIVPPAPGVATAQTPSVAPYALDDITAMVKNDVSTKRILELAQRACLSFRMNDAADTQLRRVGADPELLTGLRGTCYSAS